MRNVNGAIPMWSMRYGSLVIDFVSAERFFLCLEAFVGSKKQIDIHIFNIK
jgi:hypothetical protein